MDDQVAATLEAGRAFLQEFLRPGERGDGSGLADGGGAGGCLALDHGHSLDQVARATGITDAPAGHGIGLGDTVDRERPVLEPRLKLGRGDEAEAVIDDVLIHVVDQQPHMRMLQEHVEQRTIVGSAVGGARRVRRRVEQHPTRLRRNCSFELVGSQAETGGGVAGDQNRLAFADLDDIRIGGPVGRRDDHFVAGIDRRHHGVEQDLLGARCHRDLVLLVGKAVFTLELFADCLLQVRRAVERGVLGVAALDRLAGGILDVVGRVEVGLARTEDDDRLAFALHRLRAGADFQDFGDSDRGDPRGGLKARLLDRLIDGHDRILPGCADYSMSNDTPCASGRAFE
ncbi:hypothetical protein D9M68_489190 [compost metagenome]